MAQYSFGYSTALRYCGFARFAVSRFGGCASLVDPPDQSKQKRAASPEPLPSAPFGSTSSLSLSSPLFPMTLSVATARAELQRQLPSAAAVGTVTICGGGNGAHVAAGYLAAKGIRVNVLTRRPERWGAQIEICTKGSSWESRGTITGRLNVVSKHAKHVIPDADVVIIAAPANAHPDLLESVAPHLKRGVKLGALFAQGGFDWAAKKALGEDRLADLDLVRAFAGAGVVVDAVH